MDKQVAGDLKKFLKSFLIISIAIYLSDIAVGAVLKYLYYKQKAGLEYRTTYSIKTTKADYLIYGSSRASHHYDPEILEPKLHASVYNCGRGAHGLLYGFAVLEADIERYKPKCVIIDVRPTEFTSSETGKLASLLPYADIPAVEKYIKYNGRFENIKLLSHIYPYNSMLAPLIVGLTSAGKKADRDYKGFVPLKTIKTNVKNSRPYQIDTNNVDTDKVEAFSAMLTRLDKAQIPTWVVISPAHTNYDKRSVTLKILDGISANFKNIKFVSYLDDPICRDAKYFRDDSHLTEAGAKIFSAELADRIKLVSN